MSRALIAPLLWLTIALPDVQAQSAPESDAAAGRAELRLIPVASPKEEETPPAESSTPALLTPIVVTGEKLGRGVAETSTSLSLTTGAQLERYGDESVFDLMRRVGNLVVTDNGTFSIRGINATGVDANEFGRPLASVYVDGVAQDRVSLQAGALEAWDVQQVEILRGPQSTSQGRNSLAGSVVLATRDPTEYWELRGRALVGENSQRRNSLAGGGPLAAGLAFRLAADEARDDGYVNNLVLDDPDWAATRTRNARAKLAYTPRAMPALRAVASATYSEENEGGVDLNFEDDGTPPTRTAQAGDETFYDFRSRSLGLNLGYDFGDGYTLSSVTGRLLGDGRFQLDGDRTEEDAGLASGTNETRNFTQELRLNIRRGALRGLVGLYYGHFMDMNDARNENLPVTLELLVPGGAQIPVFVEVDVATMLTERAENQAVFAEFDWQALERLTVTAGLRYDREQRDSAAPFTTERADLVACLPEALNLLGQALCTPGVDVRLLLAQTPLLPGAGEGVAPTEFDIFLPKFGLRYALTETLEAFATYAEGYRAGGAEILFTTGQLNTFDPEFTRNYETGLRADFLGKDLGLRLNLFYVDWRDQQVMVLTESQDDSFTTNAARSRLYGGELEADWRLPRGFTAYTSLGISRTRFEDFVDGQRDFTGNEFARAPRWTGSLGLAREPGERGWLGALSLAYADSAFDDPDNDPRSGADARTLLDARLGYRWAGFTLTLSGRNLLDETYALRRTFLDPDPAFGRDRAGRLVTYGDPRRYAAQLEYRW